MAGHPDLEPEQAYLDHAQASLEAARQRVLGLRRLAETAREGTHQARVEREVVEDTIRARLAQLDTGDASLVFGRLDFDADDPDQAGERYYIGRVAVADAEQEPVVVDWRAPVAEPFYRATGRSPMGLDRRRHFATRGRQLLGIEDELFGAGRQGRLHPAEGPEISGQGALFAVLDRPRSGHLGDIVGTIQAEQDEIIRSELRGVVVVQGGPGTGKTVVALHRAAYLLYTHRFPLEGQGLLVVGPNRLYLGYIERVLPSLGEAGVELAVLADLVPEDVGDRRDHPLTAKVKGDVRMVHVLTKAVVDRQRPLRTDLVVPFGLQSLRCDVATSRNLVESARRRVRQHNAGRRLVERALWKALAASARTDDVEPGMVRERLRKSEEVRAALEWMWPVLRPAELLRDLFGSRALLRLASAGRLGPNEVEALYRPREAADEIGQGWTGPDTALLDEARSLLGPRGPADEEPRSYGHIVLDEAQDLSPMELRLLARRSLGGSMTVVGDIAQATGALAPTGWDEILAHLPARRPARRHELSIAYRTPGAVLALADRVLPLAAPKLRPPRSVRAGGEPPAVVEVAVADRGEAVATLTVQERRAVGEGNVAVVVPESLVEEVGSALARAGVDHGRASAGGMGAQVTLVPVRLVKGLELDAVLVVEPARIVDEEPQGLRSLYVALTRATRRLTVVHAEALPEVLESA